MKQWSRFLRHDIRSWLRGWYLYLERQFTHIGVRFEGKKDVVVGLLKARRGTYQWPFLHLSLVVLFIAGAASAPILASSYPGSVSETETYTPPSAVIATLDLAENMDTQRSEKPRDQVISYTVKEGDTLAKISVAMGVSVDSIKWLNDMKRDTLSVDQTLKIPPVTGIVHKVREGETVYSIAKKYKTEAQNIVNFPFNDYADQESFALNVGQVLYVPDGVMPEAAPITVPIRVQFAAVSGTGKFLWPTSGAVTQYPSWYHMAVDIASNEAPGIASADAGVVVVVERLNWGYGIHAIVDHGNGMTTLYGHMQAVYVKPGDKVGRGQIIGKMGSTGRSTGTHLHFEIRNNGALTNPLQYFK